ncbi:hypothetical protein ACSBR2_015122 [Camellia fascicularis]
MVQHHHTVSSPSRGSDKPFCNHSTTPLCNPWLVHPLIWLTWPRPLVRSLSFLNESTREITGASALEPQPSNLLSSPVLSYPEMSVEQIMATQSNIEANSYTLKSSVETMVAVTNLSRRLQNRTFELKRKATSKARFGVPSYSTFDGQWEVITFGSTAKAKAESSRVAKNFDRG